MGGLSSTSGSSGRREPRPKLEGDACEGSREQRAEGGPAHPAGDLGRIIDLFSEPAFLVDGDGRVVHANPAGRAADHELPDWVGSAPNKDVKKRSSQHAKVREVRLRGQKLWLVLPRTAEGARARQVRERMERLTPRLKQVAELLLEGLPDKEIAARLNLAPSSVRAYTVRVYRALEVKGRVELLALTSKSG